MEDEDLLGQAIDQDETGGRGVSARFTLDRPLLDQVYALARERRMTPDQLVDLALRNLLTLHDWPATRGKRTP